MKQVFSEAQGRLLRGLLRLFPGKGDAQSRQLPPIIVESFETAEWGSLTFSGHRHWITLVVAGARPAIPSLEGLDVVGAIVADVRIVARMPVATGVRLELTVLTINEKV